MSSAPPTADLPGGPYAFLLIDIDGYCTGGIDQRVVVSRENDGYRARELGWLLFTAEHLSAGSIYFCDIHAPPLVRDQNIDYTHGIHGLPVHPQKDHYTGYPVACSTELLRSIRILYETVAEATRCTVVIIHKGGNEGLWACQAIPNIRAIDIGKYGCPRVDDIGKQRPDLHVGQDCGFHKTGRRRSGKIIHCPQLEVGLLAHWIAECRVAMARAP